MKVLVVFSICFVAFVFCSPSQRGEQITPSFDAFNDCRLLLTTRENRGDPVLVTLGDLNSISQSVYRRDRPLRVSIHGWNANANDGTHLSISRVLLDRDDFNFIFVDWSAGSTTANYITARNRVSEAGAFLGAFIDWLHEIDYVDFNQVTIIGFSLGAHVAGHAGKSVQRGIINTIIGLDPAGPLFSVNQPDQRLASGDAQYVEAIHTNGRANGIGEVIGDADFFPNGGRNQPGCTTGSGCSHTRAVSFYMESIVNNRFRANRCASFEDATEGRCSEPGAFMGGEPSNQRLALRGIFHLSTNLDSPFGQG